MQCPRCEGTGKCVECDGQGSLECAICSGSGEKTTSRGLSYKCKTCSGSGTTECPPECSSCAGVGEITEELQQQTHEKYRPKFVSLGPSRALTVPLIVLNVLIFFSWEFDPAILGYLTLYRAGIDEGYYWTLITSSFVHYWNWHILCNMLFLWSFGPVAEGILGKFRYLGVYLFSALTAGSVSYLGNVILQHEDYAGIGASGPLFGLVGYVFAVHLRWRMPEAAQAPRLANLLAMILVVGFGLTIAGYPLIDNWGHLGGAVGGFLAGYLLPKPKG